MKKKVISAVAGLMATAVIVLSGYFGLGGQNSQSVIPSNLTAENSIEQKAAASEYTFPESILKSDKDGIIPFGNITAVVNKVVDGDTFHITYNKIDYKVRLLDVDTPESVKAGVKPQPYSKEASDLTKKYLTDKKIKLVFEKDTTDQYDRLLAHVILENGTYYNSLLIGRGYAICVYYSPNVLLKDYLLEQQKTAISRKAGFWALPENGRPFIKAENGKYIASYKKSDKAA